MAFISPLKLKGPAMASGQTIKIFVQITLHFIIQKVPFDHAFYVLNNAIYWGVLGTYFSSM